MSTLSDLESARGRIDSGLFLALGGSGGLEIAIDEALSPPSPTGSPQTIRSQARAYRSAAFQCDATAAQLLRVATESLPQAWRGTVADTAGEAVQALVTEVDSTATVLREAAQALDSWADALEWAQPADRDGIALLQQAKGALGWLGLDMLGLGKAQNLAAQGVAIRVAAAQNAQDVGTSTAQLLNEYASQARAEQVSGMDPLSAVVLATEADPGGAADDANILTDTQLARGSQLLAAMDPADQAAFEALLANSASPEESAYLWKALAAGHPMAQLSAFDAAIHPHGDDPVWLAEHLTPALTTPGSQAESNSNLDITYQGQDVSLDGFTLYSQGSYDDCVAASTVIAQANMDPTVMLGLTTGGTADGDDSPAAFQQRLQALYQSEYVRGQQADGDSNPNPKSTSGLGPSGETLLANKDLGAVTGSTYAYQSLGSSGDRQAALGPITQAVDSGKPVPIDVTNGSSGHQMMIIGHDGDKLEIYNPWGFTSWVTEQQFVNNDLGSLTPGDNLNSADGLELPR